MHSSLPMNHIVFFCRIPVVLENRKSSQWGVRTTCTLPLDPPLPWNSLPNSVTSTSSLNSLKTRILNYLCNQSNFIYFLLDLMLFFLLIVYVVPLVSFFSCNSEIMYSYLLDILFLIVLSFSFGGQFLYGNSVSPCLLLSFSYCTFIDIYIYIFVRISRIYARCHVAHFAARTTQV